MNLPPTTCKLAFAERDAATRIADLLRKNGEQPIVRPMLGSERYPRAGTIHPKGLTVVQWRERRMQTRIDLRETFKEAKAITV